MIARRFSALILRASGLHVAYIPGFHAKTVQLCNIANNQSPTTAALQRTITRDLWGLRFSPPTQESAKATVQVSHAHHEAEENTTHTKSNKESDLPVPFADVKYVQYIHVPVQAPCMSYQAHHYPHNNQIPQQTTPPLACLCQGEHGQFF